MDNDNRFDLGNLDDADDAPEAFELEPISLEEIADAICFETRLLTHEQKAEIRSVAERELFGVDMTIQVECENCHEPIRRSHFNSDVVWVHEPGFCGHWPNTRCKTGERAVPVFSQLLTAADKDLLKGMKIKPE